MRTFSLLLICLFCCSCASSKRMMRISPFSETRDKMPDPDRVNVWPLVYHNQDHTSMLWPVVDIDPQGFAVRPLLNKEKDDWSILFPLSSYNTKRNVGWLGPLYHYEEEDGLFPLYHFGDDFDFVGPAWWTKKGAYGLFPIFCDGVELEYLFPFWRMRSETNWTDAGIFPIMGTNRDFTDFWLWPLYAHDINGPTRKRSALLSAWRNVQYEDGGYQRHLIPFYYERKRQDAHTRLIFPLHFAYEDAESRVSINPLYGTGTNKNNRRVFTSVLGPLYLDFQPEEGRAIYAALISHFERRGDKRSGRIWPLIAWSNAEKYPDWLYHLTLAAYRNHGEDYSIQCTPLLGHWKKGEQQSTLLWPLLGVTNRRAHPNWLAHLTLFNSRQHPAVQDWSLTPLIGHTRYTSTKGNHSSRFRIWPILHTYKSPARSSVGFCLASVEKIYEENELRKRTYQLPLGLSKYERDVQEDITTWRLMYGAVNYKQDRERNRFSVLKYLYRRDQDGEQVARDIFPFIKWDSGPEKSRFALLWRLFNLETENGKTGGHVLFVPFGET